jgi:hypothetical protein
MLTLSQVLVGCALAIPCNQPIIAMVICLAVLSIMQIVDCNLPPDQLFFFGQMNAASYSWLLALSRVDALMNWKRQSFALSLRDQ